MEVRRPRCIEGGRELGERRKENLRVGPKADALFLRPRRHVQAACQRSHLHQACSTSKSFTRCGRSALSLIVVRLRLNIVFAAATSDSITSCCTVDLTLPAQSNLWALSLINAASTVPYPCRVAASWRSPLYRVRPADGATILPPSRASSPSPLYPVRSETFSPLWYMDIASLTSAVVHRSVAENDICSSFLNCGRSSTSVCEGRRGEQLLGRHLFLHPR